jgi:hypothetical protein
MFLVVCSAAAALACRDIDRPLDSRGLKPIANEQRAPTVLLSLTCEMNSASATVACKSPIAAAPQGVNASVIYGATATYAIFFPYNLVKDTVAHSWQFTAYLQNLLKQSIGTLNGTTTTGVKVFVTDFHATAGTGAVSVANADGTGTFTAPNQPYFNYNQIIAPSGYSGNKLWKFNVPNSVTAVSMSILISTDFPAEQNVTMTAPSLQPAWFDTLSAARFVPRVVAVIFQDATTLADRQLAAASVGGTVIGGMPMPPGEGFYDLSIPDSGQGVQLDSAVAHLLRLPQVRIATKLPLFTGQSGRPYDGANWRRWSLSPDTLGSDHNWALEQISAPFAWGCSTGDAATQIAVIDHPFDNTEAIPNALAPLPTLGGFTGETIRHGTWVTGVLAARGNDSTGVTGTMWRAGMVLYDLGTPNSNLQELVNLIRQAAAAHIKVVNLSWAYDWPKNTHNPTWSPNITDSSDAIAYRGAFAGALRDVIHGNSMPLVVLAAGDHPVDAFWAVTTALADSASDHVLVVGGSARAPGTLYTDGNRGRSLDVYAPGEGVYTTGASTPEVAVDGTSFSAPFVSGVAGLLLSFDTTLTATELRTLIKNGAAAGHRMLPRASWIANDSVPILNAYESLKLAAQRTGAPLCGNRVWAVNTGSSYTLNAERGSSSEVLHTGAGTASFKVLHTTRDIDMSSSETGNRLKWNPLSRAWVLGTRAVADTEMYGSLDYRGASIANENWSHSRDTLIDFNSSFTSITLKVRSATGTFSDVPILPNDSLTALGYSPRGDRILLIGSFQRLYTANPTVANVASTLHFIYQDRTTFLVWTAISEDGQVLMVAVSPSDPNAPASCTIKYKSMYTGLDVAPEHSAGTRCGLPYGFSPRRVRVSGGGAQ